MSVSYLVVDDEDDLREILVEILSDEGARVASAASGGEALARLAEARSADAEFDVLITDIQMPGMSGLELSARARADRDDLAIVLMSGRGDPGRAALEASGGDAFLQKPFGGDVLGAAIALARTRARARAEGRAGGPRTP